MTGFSAKSSNRYSLDGGTEERIENVTSNSDHLSSELNKLNDLLKSGALTQEEFEKAKKKILDN